MRNYGAAVADIGVLVVACDDGVCTQTEESIGILEQLQVRLYLLGIVCELLTYSESFVLCMMANCYSHLIAHHLTSFMA